MLQWPIGRLLSWSSLRSSNLLALAPSSQDQSGGLTSSARSTESTHIRSGGRWIGVFTSRSKHQRLNPRSKQIQSGNQALAWAEGRLVYSLLLMMRWKSFSQLCIYRSPPATGLFQTNMKWKKEKRPVHPGSNLTLDEYLKSDVWVIGNTLTLILSSCRTAQSSTWCLTKPWTNGCAAPLQRSASSFWYCTRPTRPTQVVLLGPPKVCQGVWRRWVHYAGWAWMQAGSRCVTPGSPRSC